MHREVRFAHSGCSMPSANSATRFASSQATCRSGGGVIAFLRKGTRFAFAYGESSTMSTAPTESITFRCVLSQILQSSGGSGGRSSGNHRRRCGSLETRRARGGRLGDFERGGARVTTVPRPRGAGSALPHPRVPASLPVRLFKYMAAGIPVIAVDSPSWREIVEGCCCGILIDPPDLGAIARPVA